MANQDAKTAYETAKTDIANLLGFFECELAKEPETIKWTHAGDMNYIRESLIETLSFMSGFETKQIEDTLEESRMQEGA